MNLIFSRRQKASIVSSILFDSSGNRITLFIIFYVTRRVFLTRVWRVTFESLSGWSRVKTRYVPRLHEESVLSDRRSDNRQLPPPFASEHDQWRMALFSRGSLGLHCLGDFRYPGRSRHRPRSSWMKNVPCFRSENTMNRAKRKKKKRNAFL